MRFIRVDYYHASGGHPFTFIPNDSDSFNSFRYRQIDTLSCYDDDLEMRFIKLQRSSFLPTQYAEACWDASNVKRPFSEET